MSMISHVILLCQWSHVCLSFWSLMLTVYLTSAVQVSCQKFLTTVSGVTSCVNSCECPWSFMSVVSFSSPLCHISHVNCHSCQLSFMSIVSHVNGLSFHQSDVSILSYQCSPNTYFTEALILEYSTRSNSMHYATVDYAWNTELFSFNERNRNDIFVYVTPSIKWG